MALTFRTVSTPLGDVTAVADEHGLTHVILPGDDGSALADATEGGAVVDAAAQRGGIAQTNHHPLDPGACSGHGEAQSPFGVLQKRGGEWESQALNIDVHVGSLLVGGC